MGDWLYEGSETAGVIVGSSGEGYPCRVNQGQVQVHLPFAVDQARMREVLQGAGCTVARGHEAVDSQGWGPPGSFDPDGYYPFWLWPEPESGGTMFGFPPRDFRALDGTVTDAEGIAAHQGLGEAEEATPSAVPIVGPEAVKTFARWLPYFRAAAHEGNTPLSRKEMDLDFQWDG